MSKAATAIRVRHLTKDYPLFPSPYRRLLAALAGGPSIGVPTFKALNDLTLEVPRGATFGIMGRNGSGKSTLLQLLCGILQPTGGEIETDGSVSAILDLGGGFNPELTGRENVALRSAIFGDRRDGADPLHEVERFADIGAFFDRPVRTSSSGMFVRLAFAAAIQADPDILVIDEALAVGDARFQHRCFEKIAELRARGRTIVLVTHNTEAIVRHCDRACLLEAGSLVLEGQPRDIVDAYLELLFTGRLSRHESSSAPRRGGPAPHQIVSSPAAASRVGVPEFLSDSVFSDRCPARASYNRYERRIGDRRGAIVDYLLQSRTTAATDVVTLHAGDILDIYIKARFTERVEQPMFGMSLKTRDGVVVHASNTRYRRQLLESVDRDETIVFRFALSCPLHPDDYFLDLGLAELEPEIDRPIDIRYAVAHFAVVSDARFDGLVDLTVDAGEIGRRAPASDELEGA
jgi:lipopolysaccharide transport system ATP-binding protein